MKKDKEKELKVDPKVRDVLLLLGAGAFLAASIVMPGLPLAAKPFLSGRRETGNGEWKKFNLWRLKQVLRRLQQQKLVEITDEGGTPIVKISENGQKKLLKYKLEEMELDDKAWDGKWRLVIYDIYSKKRWERDLFRQTLKQLRFLQLQKSVYLTPFSCQNEVEYLRQICDVGGEVVLLTVSGLENENAYKEYFGL